MHKYRDIVWPQACIYSLSREALYTICHSISTQAIASHARFTNRANCNVELTQEQAAHLLHDLLPSEERQQDDIPSRVAVTARHGE